MQLSPAILKELKTALATGKKKRKTVVSAGSRGITLGGGTKSSLRPPSLNLATCHKKAYLPIHLNLG
jgi:hypothetical protein